ncbi:hypothetical protein M758_UG074200 [Ceratodon purpureus]|nr:hypothetical protein M758_UG074200 [Ceratodon purpureus]KAG0594400.1 hypothetical protein M758_UG074200 [Ceratodon purpureus]KAG0594401.1 hypothetical protein M758_UG074200 [Ceratodon purpureus]
MWDSMLGKGFKAQKCKTLLRLAMARIKLLRNKREIQVKQMRKEISQLLTTGQEPSARIRVEHIIREQNILAAYDILELFCELVAVRLPIIESQKNCPLDLKEAISSLIFASPRCSDLPELLQIRQLFAAKYGKEFAAAAAELRPDCGVNRRIIEKLSVRAPPGDVKLKLMKEIAAEHDVAWDPTDTEAELLKSHEDLLDGSNHLLGGNELSSSELSRSQSTGASDAARDVPTITMSQLPPDLGGLSSAASSYEDERAPPKKYEAPPTKYEAPSPVQYGPPSPIVPPSRKVDQARKDMSSDMRPDTKAESYVPTKKEGHGDYLDVASAAQAAAESANRAVAAARAAAELARKQSGDYGSRVPERLVRQESSPPEEEEESATDLDSDEEEERSVPVQAPPQRRYFQETKPAPAKYSDSDSDPEEYDVPRGRGAGGTKSRSKSAYDRTEAPEPFGKQKPPLKATKLDFQNADASSKPAFDDDEDDSGEGSGVFSRPGKQERDNESHGGNSTSGTKGGGLKWVSRDHEAERYDIFDINRDKSKLRYSAFDSNDAEHDSSRPDGSTYLSYDQPFAAKQYSSKFGSRDNRESSPLFDEEGSVGRGAREPSRLGSFPKSQFDDEGDNDASLFSGAQKHGSNDYSAIDYSSYRDPSPKTVEEDDLDKRFEALKLARRR